MSLPEKKVVDETPQDAVDSPKEATVKVPAKRPLAKAAWGPVASLLYGMLGAFIGGYLLSGILVTVVLTLLGFDAASIDDWLRTITGVLIVSAVAAVFVVVAILTYVRRRGGTVQQLGLTTVRWRYVWVAIGGILAYLFIYAFVLWVAKKLVPSLDLEQRQELGFANPETVFQLVAVFLTLVVIPPIIEELVFRGFIYGGLRSRFNFVTTTLVTSVVFAVGHLQFGNGTPLLWVAAIDTFVLSVVMCYVRERTGSIVPTMIMHGLKNGLAFTFLFIVPFVR